MPNRALPPAEYLAVFYDGGCTMSEIADAYGVTHQAVSFHLVKRGCYLRPGGVGRVDPRRVMQSIRSPSVMSWDEIAAHSGYSMTVAWRLTTELGNRDAVTRLLRWRRRRAGRSHSADQHR